MIDRVGQQLGKYRLLSVLGRGSFAEVYLGQHIHLQSLAAIKILHTRLDSESVTAFQKEAQIIARLRHPNIITIHDFDVEADAPFFVMDYAQNGSLRNSYRPGSILPPSIILPYVKQVASALQYAHNHKVIHRDIKPANMLIGLDNTIVLSDFGLAVVIQSSLQSQAQDVAGTMAYMAPEQFTGQPVPASDQYALAVVVYEWLCGVRPFTGTAQEMEALHRNAPPRPLLELVPTLLPAIERVVMTALAKNPGKRFKNIAVFATAFEKACRSDDVIIIRELQSSTPSAVPSFPEAFPHIWNIPHRRNPLFTGREAILESIGESLAKSQAVTLAQAITGLGGIGKTQTALEYAYQNHDNYRAVLWVRADTPEVLHADFAALAGVLQLFKAPEQDQSIAIKAVQRWLQENSHWLLIIDNVEQPEIVDDLLPTHHHGHVLLTTRSQATGPTAQRINLEKMPPHIGALFLLRRTQIIRHDQSLDDAAPEARRIARDISITLDGLPLALDQAGSYIESAECGLQGFLERYQQRRAELLKHRGRLTLPGDHPISVYTTLELCFEQVAHASTAAKDLLQLCAFLYADSIPEEIFSAGASELTRALRSVAGDILAFDAAIVELRKYSLIRRNPNLHTLTVHRLVQAILKDRMSSASRHQWAERAVRVVNRAFPDVTFENWQTCERLLPHARTCAGYIEEWDMQFPEAIRLLEQLGRYMRDRALFSEAEPFLTGALTLQLQQGDVKTSSLAQTLHSVAFLYYNQGKYDQAERLFRQALEICENDITLEYPVMVQCLDGLSVLYLDDGKYDLAEEYCKRSLAICERILGPKHAHIADCLNNLAEVHRLTGNYTQAEPLFKQAIMVWEETLGPEHPEVAQALNNLALLYYHLKKYQQAEPLYQRALAIWEKTLGPKHQYVAFVLNNLAALYLAQDNYSQAELFYQKAIALRREILGAEHPDVAQSLSNLALLYTRLGKYSQAKPLQEQSLSIREKALGAEHPDLAFSLNNLGLLYYQLGDYTQALTLTQRSFEIREKALGPEHADLITSLENIARYYLALGNFHEAEHFFNRAVSLCEHILGSGNTLFTQILINQALLYIYEARYSEAESLCDRVLHIQEYLHQTNSPVLAQSYETLAFLYIREGYAAKAEQSATQSLEINEQIFGPMHPKVADSLFILAQAYQAQHDFRTAKALYQRAQNILAHNFGKEHPKIARVLHGQAELSLLKHQYAQAEKLEKRALAMREKLLGTEHPENAESLYTLAEMCRALRKNEQAVMYYQRALKIRENTLGNMHPDTIKTRKTLAALQDSN